MLPVPEACCLLPPHPFVVSVFPARGFPFTGVLSSVAVLVAGVWIVVHVLADSLFVADAIIVSRCHSSHRCGRCRHRCFCPPSAVAAGSAAVVAVLVAPAEAPSAAIAVAAVTVLAAAAAGFHWRWLWRWWRSLRLLCAWRQRTLRPLGLRSLLLA